eukprot:1058161-Prymnesium_polylepis.2
MWQQPVTRPTGPGRGLRRPRAAVRRAALRDRACGPALGRLGSPAPQLPARDRRVVAHPAASARRAAAICGALPLARAAQVPPVAEPDDAPAAAVARRVARRAGVGRRGGGPRLRRRAWRAAVGRQAGQGVAAHAVQRGAEQGAR